MLLLWYVYLYPFLTAAHNEVGFYVVLLQVGISLSPSSRLHVIVAIQIIHSGLGDVNTPETRTTPINISSEHSFNTTHWFTVGSDLTMMCRDTYPALPPASIWLANVTSLDQTSNCHFLSPSTPQCTLPLWIPTRMFTFTPVTSRTNLWETTKQSKYLWLTRYQWCFINSIPAPTGELDLLACCNRASPATLNICGWLTEWS